MKFVFGLANDEIGYIIPKSEWDEKPPWLFGSPKPVYGEVNSVGPETALILHNAIRQLADDHARAQKPQFLAVRGGGCGCFDEAS